MVPDELRERFFEKYATSGKVGGTGLGTYSARAMVRAGGGDVRLASTGTGRTVVEVVLPVHPDESPTPVPATTTATGTEAVTPGGTEAVTPA